MVFYFTSTATNPPSLIYMGKDKFENEDLIKYGWEEDVWFHVDKMSSAHVYLRLPFGQTWDSIPEGVLTDIAQLTKANSIEGSKKNNVTIIYTPWANLQKTGAMETGQVSFFNHKQVKRVYVEKKDNVILNRLMKTKEEKYPDLAAEKLKRSKDDRRNLKNEEKQRLAEEKRLLEERRKEEEIKNYAGMFDNIKTNRRGDVDVKEAEEDFM